MVKRKVIFNYEVYIPTIIDEKKCGSTIEKHKDEKGWFLQFGIDTLDENYPCSCALIEDKNGKVYSCMLSDFTFIDWED